MSKLDNRLAQTAGRTQPLSPIRKIETRLRDGDDFDFGLMFLYCARFLTILGGVGAVSYMGYGLYNSREYIFERSAEMPSEVLSDFSYLGGKVDQGVDLAVDGTSGLLTEYWPWIAAPTGLLIALFALRAWAMYVPKLKPSIWKKSTPGEWSD